MQLVLHTPMRSGSPSSRNPYLEIAAKMIRIIKPDRRVLLSSDSKKRGLMVEEVHRGSAHFGKGGDFRSKMVSPFHYLYSFSPNSQSRPSFKGRGWTFGAPIKNPFIGSKRAAAIRVVK